MILHEWARMMGVMVVGVGEKGYFDGILAGCGRLKAPCVSITIGVRISLRIKEYCYQIARIYFRLPVEL